MSEWRSTNLTRPYDFELSLFPSLNYVLFEKVGRGRWVKLFGFKKGSYIEFVDENKVRFTGFTGDELRAYVGLWYDPLNYVNEVEHRYNEVIEEVINMYRRAGLPIAINDPVITFISAFLNRVTNYHTNVVRWVRTLLKQVNEDITLINEDVLRNVSTSFQLVGLVNALRDFMRIELRGDYWSLRQDLMGIKFVGPKVADLFLLHWRGFYEAVPVDIHLVRMVRRLGLVPNFKLPSKSLCTKYTCWSCSSEECLGYLIRSKLGKLAPWFQTVSYIHDRLYCSKKLCSECVLRKVCKRNKQLR